MGDQKCFCGNSWPEDEPEWCANECGSRICVYCSVAVGPADEEGYRERWCKECARDEPAKKAFTKPFGKRKIVIRQKWFGYRDGNYIYEWFYQVIANGRFISESGCYCKKKYAKAAAKREYQGWLLEFVEE